MSFGIKKKWLIVIGVILCFVVTITSCKAPSFIMGMSEREFKSKNRGVSLVKATADGIAIYKKVNYPFGKPPDVTFFYFSDSRLTQVDKGERVPDITIEHRN